MQGDIDLSSSGDDFGVVEDWNSSSQVVFFSRFSASSVLVD
jgi:hypothetical protein